MISVIIPVYNSAAYLKPCLESVLAQTYSDLEVICVNDGSTDQSGEILAEFAARDSRILVLTRDNAGVSAARNAGLRAASGTYVTFVDSDDTISCDMYETLLDLMQAHSADIAHCGYKKIHLDGTEKDVMGTETLLVQSSEEAVECLLCGKYFVGSPCNKLYRRTILRGITFDTSLKINEDVLFNVQAFLNANIIVFRDTAKYHYYERAGSACSRTAALKKSRDCLQAAEKIFDLCKDSPLNTTAASKLLGNLVGLYRNYLLDGYGAHRQECHALQARIAEIRRLCSGSAPRTEVNYRLMRAFPRLYRVAYTCYDRIRTPNWDL